MRIAPSSARRHVGNTRKSVLQSGFAIGLIIVFSCFMVFLAGQQIVLNARFSGLLHVSTELDLRNTISFEALDRYLPDTASIVADGICRQDILQAGRKIVLRDLDRRNPLMDAQWDSTLAAAGHYIRHSLSCMPADGDLWLRLAMIEEAKAAPGAVIALLLQQSQMLAPAVFSLIKARMILWNRMPQGAIDTVNAAFSEDIRVLCMYNFREIPARFQNQCNKPAKAKPAAILPLNRTGHTGG